MCVCECVCIEKEDSVFGAKLLDLDTVNDFESCRLESLHSMQSFVLAS